MGNRPCSHLPTPAALLKLTIMNINPSKLLSHHVTGDWQEMDTEDQKSNHEALINGSRVFSSYSFIDTKFWVITEADRSSTTILLPEEY